MWLFLYLKFEIMWLLNRIAKAFNITPYAAFWDLIMALLLVAISFVLFAFGLLLLGDL